MVCKNSSIPKPFFQLTARLEILRANNIVPRSPDSERFEPEHDTPPTSETSSAKGEHSKVKNEVESGSETDDEDSIMREKALLVCFRFHVVNYYQFFIDFSRLKSKDAKPRLRKSGREGT